MRTAPLVLLLACCLAISACVYFNTFYNAKKSFREAEKERRKHEETYADWAFDQAGPELQRQRSMQADQLYDKAVRKASKVLDQYKESDLVDDAMFLIGRAYFWRGEYLNAQESFRDLETFFPSSPYFDQARYWRARCLAEQRSDDQAQSLYRELFDEGEQKIAVQAGLHLAEMAHDRGDYVAAMREYRATLEAFPKSAVRAQLWLRLGEALMALEDPARLAEALVAFDEVLKADPSEDQKYRARLNSGRVLYAMGEEDEALAVYVSLLDEGRFRRFEGRTRLLIGEWYQGRRLLDEALAEYAQVRNDFPQTPSASMALYRIGLLHLQEYGDTELGREYLEESTRESPGAQGVLLAQEMLGHLRRLEQFQRQVHRADSLYADSLGAVQGPLLWRADEAPADTVVVARSLEVLDDLFSACELYRDDIGQADSSRAYYEEVIRRFPDSDQLPRAVYSLAWIELNMRGDEEGARPHLLRLIEEFPTSAHANEARRLLGQKLEATAEELAAREFARIETLRLAQPEATEAYIPLLDSLSHAFVGTHTWGSSGVFGSQYLRECRWGYDRGRAALPIVARGVRRDGVWQAGPAAVGNARGKAHRQAGAQPEGDRRPARPRGADRTARLGARHARLGILGAQIHRLCRARPAAGGRCAGPRFLRAEHRPAGRQPACPVSTRQHQLGGGLFQRRH